MQIVRRPKVRRNERTADTVPLDSAVNIAEAKIFRPQNRKLYEKIEKPSAAMRQTSDVSAANSPATREPPSREAVKINTDAAVMKRALTEKTRFCRA